MTNYLGSELNPSEEYHTTVGHLLGRQRQNHSITAFFGRVDRFSGLFLICAQGVFPADQPFAVFHAPSRAVVVERFVSIDITIHPFPPVSV